jgi:hypothetical protein
MTVSDYGLARAGAEREARGVEFTIARVDPAAGAPEPEDGRSSPGRS